MRVLYVYCHPLADSFHAAIRDAGLNGLKAGGRAGDLLDLYAEAFEPALTANERRRYSDPARQVDQSARRPVPDLVFWPAGDAERLLRPHFDLGRGLRCSERQASADPYPAQLIFRWDGSRGEAEGVYLDDHGY